MDQNNKPRGRVKRTDESGKGVEIRDENHGLGTGPVNNTGNYEDRRAQQGRVQGQSRPVSGPRNPLNGMQNRPSGNSGRPSSSSGPMGGFGIPTGHRPGTTQGSAPAGRPGTSSRPAGTSGRPYGSYSANGTTPNHTSSTVQRPTTSAGNGQRASGNGGGSKLILILVAVAVLFFGGQGLLGGDDGSQYPSVNVPTGSHSGNSVQTVNQTNATGGIQDLLSMFLGSSTSSDYDFSGVLGGTGTSGNSGYLPHVASSPASGNTSAVDTTVVKDARKKYTTIKGKNQDVITLMVYMCGTDLESQNGMGTSDLKEMAQATLGKNINLIVYTGGCRQWRNSVISNSVNQIYQISDGKLICLEKNMGSASMTDPSTLSGFIRYCAKNFPANRYDLILWDHGGGSVSGFGYDEKNKTSGSMNLAGINTALKDGGVKFDFVGFDACLMATVENGLMLSQYADYMIASEESEPGVGWYYTNWLTKLGANTSMKTIDIGKMIVDDFIEVCNKTCRGQATTLSVVDLAELQATVPAELTEFSVATQELIKNDQYKTVSTARNNTREFAQASRIDQIDLIHFAKNLGNKEGKELADAISGAVKYNRTSGGMTNAYGLSIYFPYKKVSNVNKAVSTFSAIGMDSEYLRCIQEFASMETAGQAVSGGYSDYGFSTSGGNASPFSGLMGSLLGNGGSGYASSGDMMDLLGGLFSGNTGSFGFFSGRNLTAEQASAYIQKNSFPVEKLAWKKKNGSYGITLTKDQWSNVESLTLNVFYDTGKGFVDLGTDNLYEIDGNTLKGSFEGDWISINGQPVAYYYMNTVEFGEEYAITGYVPVMLNGVRANLILVFDSDQPYGYIAGAQTVYGKGETETVAKNMIRVGKGDRLDFICDFYAYDGTYQDSYYLGETMTLGNEVRISNTPVDASRARATYCFTDLYQNRYWTPVIP